MPRLKNNGEIILTANYDRLHTLTIGIEGEGSVFVDNEPYIDPITFSHNSLAQLEAIPAEPNWYFAGWSGDHVNDNLSESTHTLMHDSKTITATFSEIPPDNYTLIVAVEGEGHVTVNGMPYEGIMLAQMDETLVLNATPDDEWHFSGWSGSLDGSVNPAGLLMDDNKKVVATFNEGPPPTYSITFVVDRSNDGTAIDDATITLNETEHTPGKYFFDALLPGDYQYVVSKEGYLDVNGVVSITDHDVVEVVTLQSTVNITDVQSINLNVYPNPARNSIYIESVDELTAIELFTMLGQNVLESKLDHISHLQLDVGGLESGLYILRIHTRHHIQSIPIQLIP